MQQFPKKLKIFIIILSIIAMFFLYYLTQNSEPINLRLFIFLIILSIIVESLLIPLPNVGAISVGFGVILATIVLGGPLTAFIVNGIGVMFRYVKLPKVGKDHIFNRPIYKTLFNGAQYSICAGLSGIAYVELGKGQVGTSGISLQLLPILTLIFTYLLMNTLIFSILMSILSKKAFVKIWIKNISETALNSLAVGTLGTLIALGYIWDKELAVILLFGPLLLARYSYKLYFDMKNTYMETVSALTNTLEAKDKYTRGHASRVQNYAVILAKALKLADNKVEIIRTAAILHDIGKIGIKDTILNKPGKLTDEEFLEIRRHPTIGADIIKDVNYLKKVERAVRHHHERYDGFGYPDKLKGDEIPLEAAILSIADVYDAITSNRPYRKALTKEFALSEIRKNAGTQFHPELAGTFVKVMEENDKEGAVQNVS